MKTMHINDPEEMNKCIIIRITYKTMNKIPTNKEEVEACDINIINIKKYKNHQNILIIIN
jgi:hypothetical protein